MRWLDDYDKILVERVVIGEPDLPGTILRLPMIYGPGDDAHRLFPYLKRMDDGRPAILMEEVRARWRWARGYVEDVAEAVVSAVLDDRAAGRVYNVSEPARSVRGGMGPGDRSGGRLARGSRLRARRSSAAPSEASEEF